MRILITGSSGFIGSLLAKRLKQDGHWVVGIDRQPSLKGHVDEFICTDLLDISDHAATLKGMDYGCHLAASKGDWGISAREYYRDNVQATKALLKVGATVGIQRWLFFSTVGVLGPRDTPADENATYAPVTPYGESKAAAEALFEAFVAADKSHSAVVLRPSVVYGPGNPENTNIFRLIDTIYKRRFVMIGTGQHSKTTSYIDNTVAAAVYLVARHPKSNGFKVYNYVDEPVLTVRDLVHCIYRLLRREPPSWYLPLNLIRPFAAIGDLAAKVTKIDIPITRARIEKFCTATSFDATAIRKLGFNQPVDNETALGETVLWYFKRAAAKETQYP